MVHLKQTETFEREEKFWLRTDALVTKSHHFNITINII